jgi:hypothetical protein
MLRRRELCGFLARRLAALALALGPLAASAAEPDRRLAANPALGRIAAADPAEAQRLLDAIDQALRRPARPPMRNAPGLDAADAALLTENPLLEQAFHHDAVAALALLKRIKAAGGGPR